MKLIDKDKVVAEIEKIIATEEESIKSFEHHKNVSEQVRFNARIDLLRYVLSFLDTLKVKEVDLYNNGWIDCAKQMPQETKQTSDTLQGHREWTESDMVLVWDSMYGCGIDSTRNGKWRREQRGGYTGQVVHGIIAWRPIPEFREDLL